MIMQRAFLCLLAVGLSLTQSACHSGQRAPIPTPHAAPDPDLAPRSAAAYTSTTPSLPEDPIEGKRSTQQWAEHLAKEDEERQVIFDRQRLSEHQRVVKLLRAARARYDNAANESAVKRVDSAMPQLVSEIQHEVHELDPWGNCSRLLPHYVALQSSLSDAYPAARLAAIHGNSQRIGELRESFDDHLEKIEEWLEEVVEYEDEH
jgi:hypothetical protein